ncbi:MAG: ribonuclease catalytic domain-containing protein [Myxococcota bacterium]
MYTLTGRIRADVDDPAEAVSFIEELAAEAIEAPVFVDAPVVDREIPGVEVYAILDTPDRPTDVIHVHETEPGTLTVLVRDQPRNLSAKSNRLPGLKKKLDSWTIVPRELGNGTDPKTLSTQPQTVTFLTPWLKDAGIAPEAVHHHKVDVKRKRLEVLLDSEDTPALQLRRLGRTIRNATDIDVKLRHRIAGHRARDVVYAAFQELDTVEGVQVQWDPRLEGVACTVDAPEAQRDGLQRFCDRLSEQLGVPVVFVLDSKGEVMVERLLKAFPEEGIVTGFRHVEGKTYVAEALLPLQDHDVLLAWTDQMEAEWGVQILIEDPRLRAPDLRYADRLGSDADTIALRYNRPRSMPSEIQTQADELVNAFDLDAEVASGRRRDLRQDRIVMSIDPTRTKDLDDALSINALEDGRYAIGVHIADVSPFVPQDTPIDREALKRSFTTYLAEGEIPVLPPILADQVCSLHGGQDSPALSLLFTMDEALNVTDVEVVRSAIHNYCRFDYSTAQGIIDGDDHEYAWAIRTLDRLAQALRSRRKEQGSLDLSLEPDPEKRSHQLIEEFMLLANEQVARYLVEHHPKSLCLYRVHPHVGETDWGSLQQVAQYLDLDTRVSDQASMQRALEEAAAVDVTDDGQLGPTYRVFRYHVGQLLQKATYHFEQLGHGALHKDYYAHFTSPIRRYPDLIVHRLLEDALYAAERDRQSSYEPEGLLTIQEHVGSMEIRVDAGSFESHRLVELQAFDRGTRVEDGLIVGLMRGWAAIRLDRTDLSVSVRYRDEKTLGVAMPVRVTDQGTGLSLSLGQRVTVRTHGVDWARTSVEAEIIGVGGR